MYGRGAAEEAWGEILAGHARDSYVLATKVYFPMSDADQGLSAVQIHKQIDAVEGGVVGSGELVAAGHVFLEDPKGGAGDRDPASLHG